MNIDEWYRRQPWYRRCRWWLVLRWLDLRCRLLGHKVERFGPAASPWLICSRCGDDLTVGGAE